MMRQASLMTLIACMALGLSSPARAEGPGIKAGDRLVIHPGISVGAGYDTNVFYASESPIRAFYLDVRPGIDLSTLSLQRGGDTPHTLDFRFHAGLPLRFLLSGDPTLYRHYSIGADAGLLLTLFPQGAWTFDVFDNFIRSSTPPYSLVAGAYGGKNINFDNNQAGLRLRWRPGGGRFETTLQYTNGFYYFENPELRSKTDLTNDFQLRLKWKFFPKTALYVNVGETTNTYLNKAANTPPSAYPLRAVAGLIGLITPKLSFEANIGYGNSFTQSNAAYPNSNSYSSVIALAEATWKPLSLTQLNAGYRHDFGQALIGTYYDLDSAWIGLDQMIWRLTGALRFVWERRAFHGRLAADSFEDHGTGTGANRIDHIIGFHAQIDYPIRDWLSVGVGNDLAWNHSNCTLATPTGSNPGPTIAAPCNYLRDDVYLRLSVAY